MHSSGFWREFTVRVGTTAIMAAIAMVFLRADPWIWLMPAGVAVLVAAKWHRRPPDEASGESPDGPRDGGSVV